MRFSSWALVFAVASLHAQPAKSAASCDRACLEGFVNQYLDAMVARNPYSLPLAPKVKFTENEQVIPLGEGIWGTASGLGTYKLYVADPQGGHKQAFSAHIVLGPASEFYRLQNGIVSCLPCFRGRAAVAAIARINDLRLNDVRRCFKRR